MKRTIKYIAMTLITAEITLLCLFLPTELSKWQDRQSFGSIHLEDAEDIKVERNQQMTILEKLNLFINAESTSNQMNIKQGKYLKEEDLPEVCEREINRLKELGIIKNITIDVNSTASRIQSTFYLSTEDPTNSMIVWGVDYIDGKSFVSLSLDDETGKILSFSVKGEEQVVNTDADEFVNELAQYYEIKVDDYNIKKRFANLKADSVNQTSFAVVTFSEGTDKLDCSIQIYAYGWYYYGY